MAELGQTQDPKALVPGEPSDLHVASTALTTQSTAVDTVGDDLKAVTAPGWEGDAADSFQGMLDQHPPLWHSHADDLDTAATQVTTYADTLKAAQGQAQHAIDLWNRAETQSATFADEQAEPDADPNAVDPGNALRAEAQQVLSAARSSVEGAGAAAASALAGLVSGLSFPIGGAAASGNAEGPGANASATGFTINDDGTITLGSASAEAYLFQADGSVAADFAGVHAEAEGSVFGGAEANASATVGLDGLNAQAGAFAGVRAEGSASASLGYGEVGVAGEAEAGASAEAGVDVGPTGVSANAEAFAGAQASGSASVDVGGVGATGTAEGWAGVGASADLDVGYSDGQITIGGHLGAALGLGGQLGGSITIDPGKVVDTVTDVADDVGDFAGDVSDGVGDAASFMTGGLL